MIFNTPPEVLRQALHEALYREGQLNHDLKDLRTQLAQAQEDRDEARKIAEFAMREADRLRPRHSTH
jgi:Arc/MetJ-type ribon-helix-helix transcriptional regulator